MSSTYIFVDGGYLQRAHAESVAPWFGSETEIDLSSALARLAQLSTLDDIWGPMAYSPNGGTRIFYYDCLDEDRRGNETDREFSLRLDQQNNRLQELRDINDCHIRLGTLKGRKRREQKEVDVLIAVEMMAHAARGNMQKAVLVTGDLDLRPAVEALVQLGLSVEIISNEKTTSRELTWAGSSFRALTFKNFFDWTRLSDRHKFPIPIGRDFTPHGVGEIIKQGSVDGLHCTLHRSENGYLLYFPIFVKGNARLMRTFEHENLDRIELFFKLEYKPILWDNSEITTEMAKQGD